MGALLVQQLLMLKLAVLVMFVTTVLAGCGDPPPSTKLAPDVAPPDTSKFSKADMEKFQEGESRNQPPRR